MKASPTFTAPSWPTGGGPCGTGWERVQVICDWLDLDVLFKALCKVSTGDAILNYRTVARFDFSNDSDMVHFCLAYDRPGDIQWEAEERVAHLDPCDDPESLDQLVTSAFPCVSLSMATIFQIDMRDEVAYTRFVVGCRERLPKFRGMAPQIEFMVR